MRIVLHDYAGHAFILELGRKLASQGHTVLHLCSKSVLTPQGDTDASDKDASTFCSKGIVLSQEVQKESFVKRRNQDREHGLLAAAEISKFSPDIVVCSNTPLEAMTSIQKKTRELGAKFVFWCQDINGIAIKAIVGKKIPVVGNFVGDYYIRLESKLLSKSDAIIAISEDFKGVFSKMGVRHERTYVLPNWAPLDQLPLVPRANSWSQRNSLDDQFVFLYSGTLGFKHNPNLLLRLAEEFRDNTNVTVQVVSGGKAVEWLDQQAKEKGLSRLKTLPFQPFAEVPSVFGSADVLIAILEPSASEFSVPSKVLAYLCAERPLLLAVPKSNLVARVVEENSSGLVVSPDDEEAFVAAAKRLYEDAALRASQSTAGRAYAEKTFDIESVSSAFVGYLQEAVAAPAR